MDWEESPPPPNRELLDKNSTSQSHHQFLHHHRLITTTSAATATLATQHLHQHNGTNSSSINGYRIGNQHHGHHHAINLSENNNKSGFNSINSHNHFSSSSTNTSPSGSSASSSPPLLLSSSVDSNGSSIINSSVPAVFNTLSTLASPSKSSLSDNSPKTATTNSSACTSSNNTNISSKRNKPIPPPLDLSIGAANLSLHSSDSASPTPINLLNSASTINGSCVTPHFFQPYYYLASPKFNQAEKSLPLRKRWHSWSPVLMNSQVDPMLPLYAETSGSGGNGHNQNSTDTRDHDQTPTNTQSALTFSINNSSSLTSPSPWSSSSPPSKLTQSGTAANNSAHPSSGTTSIRNNSKNSSNELQTPTPFYTPNEPSPKFMNSPVFSYSTPDTSLYQGPFSPVRTSNLFPPLLPSSPFIHSHSPNLNTPTFTSPNNGAHSHSSFNNTSNSTTTLTVPTFNGTNYSSSSPHSSSSSMSTTTFSTLVPSTLLSPTSSQASSSNSVSYEDLHEKSTLSSLNNSTKFNPIWNIFIPGTRIRFSNGVGSMDWHLVDIVDLKDDYAPNGLEVRTLVVTCSAKERVEMTFCPVADPTHPAIEVNCDPGHPFMVEKKGWCAVNPDVFFETHGIRCQPLVCGDVCVKFSSLNLKKSPQQQQQQSIQAQIQADAMQYNFGLRNGHKMPMLNGSTISSLDMKPVLDQHQHHMNLVKHEMKSVSPLAHIPISVVRQKQQVTPNPPSSRKKSGNSTSSASKKSKNTSNSQSEPRGRRPMNAFLLFAKDKRPELIQLYPGKDNRSISVLLGEAWQSLGPVDKGKYASSARTKAEEQKRVHPDCWKRKKAQSATLTNSSGNNSLNTSGSNKNIAYSPISMSNYQNHIDEM